MLRLLIRKKIQMEAETIIHSSTRYQGNNVGKAKASRRPESSREEAKMDHFETG